MLPKRFLPTALLCLAATAAGADEVGCVTTTWKLVGANHRICVEAFHDAKVPGVTCHVSQARIVRMWDKANGTLVYLAISRKLIDGAPANSISTVPVMPWGSQ